MQNQNIKNQTNNKVIQGEVRTMNNKDHESLLRPKAGYNQHTTPTSSNAI